MPEPGKRKVVPAVLIYAKNRGRVLMIHRTRAGSVAAGTGDHHSGKWNGLGGKHELELDESPLECAMREFREESGLDLPAERFRAVGMLSFPLFKANKDEDWTVTVFSASVSDEEAARVPARAPGAGDASEGELHWIAAASVPGLALWPGDREFIGHALAERPFIGTIWYEGERVKRVWIQELGPG